MAKSINEAKWWRKSVQSFYCSYFSDLYQELANHAMWVKCSPPSIFVNKVLTKHSYGHSLVQCLWLLCYHSRVEYCNKDHTYGPQRLSKVFTILSFTEKLANPDLSSYYKTKEQFWKCNFYKKSKYFWLSKKLNAYFSLFLIFF